jgi:DNA-binding helix-turn-helix protein
MDYFASNLKHLRKSFGETQEDLADFLFTSKSAISNYESGVRFPDEDVLNKISKHYQVTLSQLLNEDLTVTPSLFDYIKSLDEDSYHLLNRIFIPFKLKDSLTSKEYKKAFEEHLKLLYGSIEEKETVDIGFIIDVYEESIGNCDKPIFLLNFLSFYFLMGLSFLNTSDDTLDLEQFKSYLRTKKRNKKDIKKVLSNFFYLDSDEFGNENVDFESRREFDESLLFIIEKLKKTQYSDVAYYYFALRYVFNIPNNSENRATNRLIGMTLINDLAEINNKYANKFIAIMKKVHKL